MQMFLSNFFISLPLFALVAAGFLCAKAGLVTADIGKAISRYSFNVAIPVLLFRLMSRIAQQPAPDWNIIFAFFGSCFLIFAFGKLLSGKLLKLPAADRTIFGMACVFSNNVQLGVPVAAALLGEQAMPSVAVIFSLNGFLMWTLATVSIEMARAQSPSLGKNLKKGFVQTLKNPIVIGIICGTLWSFSGLEMPEWTATTIGMMAQSAAPVALFSVGVGLTQYRLVSDLPATAMIAALKLFAQPLLVLFMCSVFGLSRGATQAAVLLGCLPVGVNVYIMSLEFGALQAAAANSLLVTTALASVTLPLLLGLFGLI